jgi:hypothetical protein
MNIRPCLLAIVLAAASAYAAEPTYEIKLDRPALAGEVYEIHEKVEYARQGTMTLPGEKKDLPKETTGAECSGRIKVDAVDAAGEPSEFTLTVKTLKDGDGKSVIAEGAKIHIKMTADDVSYSLVDSDAELSDDARSALDLLYDKIGNTQVSDDAVYPAKTPKKPGDKWDINIEKAAEQALSHGAAIDKKKTTGSALLKEIKKDTAGTQLVVELTLNAAATALESMPDGLTFDSATLKCVTRITLPSDPAVKHIEQVSEEHDHLIGHAGEEDKPVSLDMTADVKHTYSRVLVK